MLYPFVQRMSYWFHEDLSHSFAEMARMCDTINGDDPPALADRAPSGPRGQQWGVAPTPVKDEALEHTEGHQDTPIPP